jgi:hypothetical protein
MDRSARIGKVDRRPARSAHPPRSHPGDERRQLPPQAEPSQTDTIRGTLNTTPPSAPRGSSSAPSPPQSPNIQLLVYFYSAPLAWFYSALDSTNRVTQSTVNPPLSGVFFCFEWNDPNSIMLWGMWPEEQNARGRIELVRREWSENTSTRRADFLKAFSSLIACILFIVLGVTDFYSKKHWVGRSIAMLIVVTMLAGAVFTGLLTYVRYRDWSRRIGKQY